ncbi:MULTISPECIES: FAD-dependent oxidoreductase [Bradyrhizobium]|uniref:FAD-dependent oxidoreductase n=1 Tax=Bradyrhizobium TaxID=374 RepID=UPI0002F15023|nr:FAD-dependent oxidoreductase [Bradyrhizobium japonicum]AJA64804.1 succinate dehydrogenase [Bradyrhizobium japonicum]KMJ97431.1 succinate dehydrogenase [Bradyrhizobium japonicum]MBR0764558.1 FAD-dependent oxidoreductase [Bradyrhizobium japonicum]MCS3538234.1 succinate dehydrogenase/fumarate reductase flavoprotein subunit [Bradyrhizobium japonicum]MCS3985679.1 succinate dehydrogenase/fumarate reductase flavoprotein subunit [Bradyrhizobium japonicum]
MMPAHETYDVIVVGAGAGGMTAAAVAAAEGLHVLVIEKTAFVGGTTAWCDGMVWIPANPKMKDVGLSDSITDAVRYLSSTVPEPANAGLRAAFLARGPEAVAYLEANAEVRLQPVKACPDCYPERLGATSGGRVLEPVAFDGSRLGAPFARLRAPLPQFTLFGGMMVNRLDIPHLRRAGKSLRSTLRAVRLVSEYALQRLRNRRGTTLHLGNALAARLYASLLARQVEILFCADVEDLSMQGDRVGGVVIRHGSRDRLISARRGVVVATGGFSHDAVLRKRFFPAAAGFVSAASTAGTGDGLRLAATAGAALNAEATNPAYWVPASLFRRPDGSRGVFPHTVTDRAKPGVIAINAAGRRFVNEALSHHEFVLAMLRDGNGEPDRPFYLVCDRQFLWSYGLGRIKPFTLNFRRNVASGELLKAPDIAQLAAKIGVNPSVLTATIAGYNVDAKQGRDPEFGRGSTIYQRHLGDASHKPNPCVAPILRAPFFAMRIHPADLGTAIGMKVDAQARVLREDGTPVAGLYACGNDMGSIMNGNYPAPGITLGPALTFGYIAGRHLAEGATVAPSNALASV